MSFSGSQQRIWRFTTRNSALGMVLLSALAVVLIAVAWTMILGWYLCFGLLLVPYRVVRRGQRKSKRETLRHRELMH